MNDVIEILKRVGAVITDSHFVGTSGKHFATYINKDALYPYGKETAEITRLLADKAKDLGVEVVVGPALGGIILAQWAALFLSELNNHDVLGIYTEKTADGGQSLTRGHDKLVNGKKVFVVEDLTTTGGSVKKVIDAVRAAGGTVVAVAVMANRRPETVTSETFGVPFFPLAELEVPNYDESECPLCQSGVPVNTTIGHGKKFMESKNASNR